MLLGQHYRPLKFPESSKTFLDAPSNRLEVLFAQSLLVRYVLTCPLLLIPSVFRIPWRNCPDFVSPDYVKSPILQFLLNLCLPFVICIYHKIIYIYIFFIYVNYLYSLYVDRHAKLLTTSSKTQSTAAHLTH